MLRRQDVTVGKWYVNNKRNVARAVLRADEKTVQFNTHHLDSGNSCDSSSECTRQEFVRWADREASPSETASLQNQKMEALLRGTHSPYWEALEYGTVIDPGAVVL
mgnify:FL=1|jgi:hypothetical protein